MEDDADGHPGVGDAREQVHRAKGMARVHRSNRLIRQQYRAGCEDRVVGVSGAIVELGDGAGQALALLLTHAHRR